MQKFKVQFQRLIFIHRKILNGIRLNRLPNCRTLAQEWESISRRTILRDIDYMKYQLKAPIEYDRKQHGYYYTDETYQMPMLLMRESDIFAIYLADKVLAQYRNTPLYGILEGIFEKLSAGLPDKIKISPPWLDSRLSFLAEPAPKIDPDVWATVFHALFENRVLEITYLTVGDKNTKQRQLEPYHVFGFRGEWYIVAYCHLRQSIRMFAFSRIAHARTTKEKFVTPEDFGFERFIGDHFGVITGSKKHTIRVRFTGKCAVYAKERQWQPDQVLSEDKGDTIIEFQTTHTLEVMRWVLSWGSCAKVEGDKEFAEIIKNELSTTLNNYRI